MVYVGFRYLAFEQDMNTLLNSLDQQNGRIFTGLVDKKSNSFVVLSCSICATPCIKLYTAYKKLPFIL